MINTARDELRDALARRATAEGALESARQASARGRALIETIAREIEAVEEASMRTSSSLAAEMRAAITRGGAPSVAANDRERRRAILREPRSMPAARPPNRLSPTLSRKNVIARVR